MWQRRLEAAITIQRNRLSTGAHRTTQRHQLVSASASAASATASRVFSSAPFVPGQQSLPAQQQQQQSQGNDSSSSSSSGGRWIGVSILLAYELFWNAWEDFREDLQRVEAELVAWSGDPLTPPSSTHSIVSAATRSDSGGVRVDVSRTASGIDVAVFSCGVRTTGKGNGAATVVINAGSVAAARPLALELASQGATVLAYTHAGLTGGGSRGSSSQNAAFPGQSPLGGSLGAEEILRRIFDRASAAATRLMQAGVTAPFIELFFRAPPPLAAPPDSESESEELVEVLRHCEVSDPAVLVSMGFNWLATVKTALRNPAMVKALVLVDPLVPSTRVHLPQFSREEEEKAAGAGLHRVLLPRAPAPLVRGGGGDSPLADAAAAAAGLSASDEALWGAIGASGAGRQPKPLRGPAAAAYLSGIPVKTWDLVHSALPPGLVREAGSSGARMRVEDLRTGSESLLREPMRGTLGETARGVGQLGRVVAYYSPAAVLFTLPALTDVYGADILTAAYVRALAVGAAAGPLGVPDPEALVTTRRLRHGGSGRGVAVSELELGSGVSDAVSPWLRTVTSTRSSGALDPHSAAGKQALQVPLVSFGALRMAEVAAAGLQGDPASGVQRRDPTDYALQQIEALKWEGYALGCVAALSAGPLLPALSELARGGGGSRRGGGSWFSSSLPPPSPAARHHLGEAAAGHVKAMGALLASPSLPAALGAAGYAFPAGAQREFAAAAAVVQQVSEHQVPGMRKHGISAPPFTMPPEALQLLTSAIVADAAAAAAAGGSRGGYNSPRSSPLLYRAPSVVSGSGDPRTGQGAALTEAIRDLAQWSAVTPAAALVHQPHLWGVPPEFLAAFMYAGAGQQQQLPAQAALRGSSGGALASGADVGSMGPADPAPRRPPIVLSGLFGFVYDNFGGGGAPGDGAAAAPPFPVRCLLTELSDARLGEPAPGPLCLDVGGNHGIGVSSTGSVDSHHSVEIKFGRGGLLGALTNATKGAVQELPVAVGGRGGAPVSSPPMPHGAGAVPDALVHTRLLLQAEQRWLVAFWSAALPDGSVSTVAAETNGEVGSCLRRVNAAVRSTFMLEESSWPALAYPPVDRSVALWRRPVLPSSTAVAAGATPARKQQQQQSAAASSIAPGERGREAEGWEAIPASRLAASPFADEPLTSVSHAMSYGAAEPYRPSLSAVGREVLKQAAAAAQ